jgi:hypothetical protein
VVLWRFSKLSLCRKELEAGGGKVRAASRLATNPPGTFHLVPLVLYYLASRLPSFTLYNTAHLRWVAGVVYKSRV